jgi:hypothetical protein
MKLLRSLALLLALAPAAALAQDWLFWDGQRSRLLPPGPTRAETLKSKVLRDFLKNNPGCALDGVWKLDQGRFWLTGFHTCKGPLDLKTVYGWPISPNNDPLRSDWLNATVFTYRGALLCGSGKPGSHSLWAEHWVLHLNYGRALEHQRYDRRSDPRVPKGTGPHAECLGKPDSGLAPREAMPIALEPPAKKKP